MDGFQKIDLDRKPLVQNAEITQNPVRDQPSQKKSFPKKTGIILLVFLVILALFTIILLAPIQKVLGDVKRTQAQVQITVDAIKKQNIELASQELDKTKAELVQTQKDLGALGILKIIPIVNVYYNDAIHLVNAGFYGLDAARVLIDSVEPYADVLGLKGKGSFVGGTASQRIQTAVATMGKITPHIDDIAKALIGAQKEVDQVNPNHYPPFFGGDKAKKALSNIISLTDQGVLFVNQARPLIKILPSLLGDPKEKKYLVLFQNDKELRPTGGFITAYAVFRIDQGIIHVDRADDIYTLDNSISLKPKAPEPILKYLPKVSLFNIRDSNLSPDFVESMKTFNSLYAKARDRVSVDGVIAIDTHVLVSTIKILDDEVYAGGIRFTTKTDPRCDCPQVIYELERLISTPRSLDLRITSLAAAQAERKDIIGLLLYAIMEKALKSSPKLYWGPLFQDMVTQASQKHILLYIYNSDAQMGIESLNAAGRIKKFEGDYLHINEANFGGAKSNLFVKESVVQDFKKESDGSLTKKITIHYKNPHPPSDCNLERGNLCLNAVLRNWVRIYVPKGSELLESQGSEVKMTSYEELGKTVFEGFLTVRPQGAATLIISYRLPFKIASGSPLPLLIQKQPGTNGNEYTIEVRGGKVDNFKLLTDKEVKIKL